LSSLAKAPKGLIPKIVKFSETNLSGLDNFAFGDKELGTDDLNDFVISNNGDSEKVLATVVAAVYGFTEKHLDCWIYATGSTKSRTRLYRIGISKYIGEIRNDFEIYGLKNSEWEIFEKETEYEAFLAKRKNK